MPLYLVATPIGNLNDISARALDTLRAVDLIACEDTRHTLKLLNHFGIKNRLVSYHEHNETERSTELLEELKDGRSVAVVTDAGTPGINDPGFRIVELARNAGVDIYPVPGPVAFVSAVVASGLPTDAIFFGGFLPSRGSERRKRLEETGSVPATLVFYESPHRIAKSLADCVEILGDRRACVAREITKLHEEYACGRLVELAARFGSGTKGEIVLVIERESDENTVSGLGNVSLEARIRQLESEGFDPRSALKKAAKEFGMSKPEAYRRLLQSKSEKGGK
ncbi:MAG TPA: 16S rRNA (cytidine(1402)-2'-O)-methyltransferase [Pyrinomonadaceae bacterium]|nr:16S rRNA (cytidine(1402)-2'-O)-methyltransferase [Pyrinomonadaceae bacterium]